MSSLEAKINWGWLLFASGLLALIPSAAGLVQSNSLEKKLKAANQTMTTEQLNNLITEKVFVGFSTSVLILGIIFLSFQYYYKPKGQPSYITSSTV